MEENATVIEIRPRRIRNFIEKHKVAIAVVTTAAAGVVVNRMVLKQHDEFLREHDLYDAYYTVTDDE